MTFLKEPFYIGNLELPNNIFYAPLAGCSDFPYRKLSRLYQKGLIYCEMVKMDALIRFDHNTFHLLDFSKDMHPIGAQLCGSKPAIAGEAARIIEELGFDVVDLNCGCPVDKVTKDGSGSGMLKNSALIGDILAEMVAAVKIPVTVKIRAGWDDESIVAPDIVRIAEAAGAKAVTIHGRTREQGYKGPANRNWIKEAKEAAKTIKVIGNGDVLDGPSALAMFEETGCDGVLVARGTMGTPWAGEDIAEFLRGGNVEEKDPDAIREALLAHFYETVKYQGDRRAAVDMRRVGCWYVKKGAGAKAFRHEISRVERIEDVADLIKTLDI